MAVATEVAQSRTGLVWVSCSTAGVPLSFSWGFCSPLSRLLFLSSYITGHFSPFHSPISRIGLLSARAAVGRGVISTVLEWPPLRGSMGGEKTYVPSCLPNADSDN